MVYHMRFFEAICEGLEPSWKLHEVASSSRNPRTRKTGNITAWIEFLCLSGKSWTLGWNSESQAVSPKPMNYPILISIGKIRTSLTKIGPGATIPSKLVGEPQPRGGRGMESLIWSPPSAVKGRCVLSCWGLRPFFVFRLFSQQEPVFGCQKVVLTHRCLMILDWDWLQLCHLSKLWICWEQDEKRCIEKNHECHLDLYKLAISCNDVMIHWCNVWLEF